ncbi:LysR family transcriptional regulator [Rhizobium ruizarguesonis]|uniref:LysR family transcriptional regulator n=1 Tax=Rhizobium ruizarguesonis TaxID=2081791 RepID=UPI00103000A8|nr:LysR family transcriptional regulator [Rhizobium ruizarguesonis]QIJ39293.1 LysR family transcriptional regulator [Rhizobium leguminosarum]NEH32923.1 LysR family transcriptional regulator [Rhizobium ruizarguesonis]NEJ10162.1 LysR family transcriptional regulator [Rhizobium ruizarguesonis]NEK12646.1 LysR family transcriptional regulator [Rhizobium ruizarguesonis]TAT82665.1 LysR family transcriptional regulator [Rhizobium ruizarguesonis]
MSRDSINDLTVFLAVAREQSFTRAAAKLGVSPSALSHSMRLLEERLGVRLLTRTTRRVSVTDAGERLLHSIEPHFDGIDTALAALTELRDKPAGTVRITAGEHPTTSILWPAIERLLPEYPDIKFEITVDGALTDIVAERYDAGIRLGEQLNADMIAVRIGPEMRMVVVGSPDYFARHPKPSTPQDLTAHACINLRLPTYGGYLVWEFEKDGREVRVRVDGPLAFNNTQMVMRAALGGVGLAYLFEDHARDEIESGRLVTVLDDWNPLFDGYFLYYPSRRQMSPAFSVLVDALRYRTSRSDH